MIVLFYFAQSPFFDATSNNATLYTQALNNQNMYHLIQTRDAFEGRLQTMQGLEFIVTQDPSDKGTKVENSGVWVIRKQIRRKRQGMEDELTKISSYYIVGENIYMAPTVGGIIGSRLLSTATTITKMLSTASTMPTFTPALGHTYLSPAPKDPNPGTSFQISQTSKQSIPMPESLSSLTATQDTAASKKSVSSAKAADPSDEALLADSYRLLLAYGNEYMDENPIVGEPGSFKLSKARDSQKTASATTSTSTPKPESQQSLKELSPPTTSLRGGGPPQLKTENLPSPAKKDIKGGEKSPTTPFSKEKKRKKSKVPGVGDPNNSKVTTPKTAIPE